MVRCTGVEEVESWQVAEAETGTTRCRVACGNARRPKLLLIGAKPKSIIYSTQKCARNWEIESSDAERDLPYFALADCVKTRGFWHPLA